MKSTCPFYIGKFEDIILFIKICKIQLPDLLCLVVFISFYISQYHFSQIFRSAFNIMSKKNFCCKFSFFNRFTQTPLPPQQPKFAKCGKSFFWMLPNHVRISV